MAYAVSCYAADRKPMIIRPNTRFEEWLALSEVERLGRVRSWDQCSQQGAPPLKEIVESFRQAYSHRKGLQVEGYGDYHGSYVIAVRIPFIFDRRLLPQSHLGLWVRASYVGPIPPEFSGPYIWATENWERFLDRCPEEVRRELRKPEMSREEMLQALGGPTYRESERLGQAEG